MPWAKVGPAGITAAIGDQPGRGSVALMDFDGFVVSPSRRGEAEALSRGLAPIPPGTFVFLGEIHDRFWATQMVVPVEPQAEPAP